MKIEVVQCSMCKHYDSEQYCEVWEQYITNDAFYCACGIKTDHTADTPQTETSTNDEKLQLAVEPQTDCLTCRYNSDEWDSPKCDSCSKAHSNYEPQTDCSWK